MQKAKNKSFRLHHIEVTWLENLAKEQGVSQTEILNKCINNTRLSQGNAIKIEALDTYSPTIEEDEEALRVLQQLGISTASGIAGYYIAGYIRKKLDYNEDEGIQMLSGLFAGLGTLILQALYKPKN